jgi:hypothetical protein
LATGPRREQQATEFDEQIAQANAASKHIDVL